MDIRGKRVLVLGAAGLVGSSVCRALLAERPARITVAARRAERARDAAGRLRDEHPGTETAIAPAWGDVFLRNEWQREADVSRGAVLEDPILRARLVDDILGVLDDDIVESSRLVQLIAREASADVVVDCMNTATAISYQDIYGEGARLRALAAGNAQGTDWSAAVEGLLATLSVPMLVRHVQLLNEGMRRAGTQAYVKVGTTGAGGFGFNIPYTHGEEKPSRLLLAKVAVAGAQALLTFMMARTPGGPAVVKQVTPAACIGWRAIGHGPISRRGRGLERWDCPPELAVPVGRPGSLDPAGDFGVRAGDCLEGVYIDTGENGVFTADEFQAITAPGQMQLVTPEEIALNVVRELRGSSTGRETVAALDGSVMGPSHRGGHLREVAMARLRALEAEHGPAVAFEILGPPRLSKLLFEAQLLRQCCETLAGVLARTPRELSELLEHEVMVNADLRQRALSIGVPILLADGERLLRGPTLKAEACAEGWIDVGVQNMRTWRTRVEAVCTLVDAERSGEPSSAHDHAFAASWAADGGDALVPGEVVAWVLTHEERGWREKS